MNTTCIHLIRHGEVHNPDQILYGRLPRFRLSARGRAQARSAGDHLRAHDLRAVFSSPLLRTRQTAAEILTFFPNRRLHQTQRLIEVHTVYEGLPGARVDALNGDIYTGAPPEYEQPADIVARMQLFLQQARRQFVGGQVAAVTHGDVIVFTMLWAKGFDLTAQNKVRLKKTGFPASYPAHASITTLEFRTAAPDERPVVRYRQPWA
ncbi:MAG: histidine phosphatase family protein [Desulfatitalea sp.]|nr:histidine phosphatase family protein [Desulfatitalea sp.]